MYNMFPGLEARAVGCSGTQVAILWRRTVAVAVDIVCAVAVARCKAACEAVPVSVDVTVIFSVFFVDLVAVSFPGAYSTTSAAALPVGFAIAIYFDVDKAVVA